MVPGEYTLLSCRDCGLTFLELDKDPHTEFDDYWNDINERIYTEVSVVHALRKKYLKYLDLIKTRVVNTRLLDVGSGVSIFFRCSQKFWL